MDHIIEILQKEYNLTVSKLTRLNGYANLNYLIDDGSKKYILKEYAKELGLLEFLTDECNLLELLGKEFPGYFQKPVRSVKGDFLVKNSEIPDKLYRLLYFIEGKLFREVEHNAVLLESVGTLLARMDKVLLENNYLAIAARRYDWDILQIDLSRSFARQIVDPSDKKLVDYFYQQYNQVVRPLVPELRHCIIHGDANDFNILVNNNSVAGLIDFGDSVFSLLVNELAIAITYAMFDKENPLEWAGPMISAYCKVLPLSEKEIDLLYYLVGARLCISISKSANARHIAPGDEYLTVSENQALALIRKWVSINPIKASETFREAAGLKSNISRTIKSDTEKRWKHLSRAFSLSYPDNPIKMEKAAFQYMYDNIGNTYLDTRNNIPHVGHCHPKVVEAGQRQMSRLNTNTRYIYDVLNVYSEKLLSKFPPELNRIFYVNSGSAASDLAIRLALTHTKKQKLVVIEYGYHGNTALGIDISHYKFSGRGGSGKKENVIIAPAPDIYRGKYQNQIGSGELYATELIEELQPYRTKIAAFIAEPIISAAGQIPLTKGYYNIVYPFIKEQGGVCISDEVQTGFGRLGKYFWAFEISDFIPDIVILGKPIGNGHPMAAVVCTSEIEESFNNGMEFFSSFGGNPVSCAIGLAVLEVMEEEGLMNNARKVGEYMMQQLNMLKEEIQFLGDIRGEGFCLGLEIVLDKMTRTPATALTHYLVNELKNRFILVDTDGPFQNVLKIKPPLCFTRENADYLIHSIKEILLNNR